MVIGASGKSVAATVTVRKTRSDVLTEEQITEVEKLRSFMKQMESVNVPRQKGLC